ncbi:hypothetical protein [Bacteroides stercorirosoris]|uniref:hypothetical protein n=1 Tax=Bacteroides stercorirosoris TaxID=871324 RepID=UPI001900ED8C|nr:hypothetical protein [Bacteroides stercorirosoris]
MGEPESEGIADAYRFYYKGITDAKVLEDATDGRIIGRWKVKFREPKPGFAVE